MVRNQHHVLTCSRMLIKWQSVGKLDNIWWVLNHGSENRYL